MKQRPILFSTQMVQAILAGRKTQTRRVMGSGLSFAYKLKSPRNGIVGIPNLSILSKSDLAELAQYCPYGQVGDVLWVRETWQWDWIDCDKKEEKCYFFKTSTLPNVLASGEKWKPSIHMPKDAARIWLKIINVRVERLQEISEEDAIREGIENLGICNLGAEWKVYTNNLGLGYLNPVYSFISLWESINGRKSWDNNPWVWVIEFERIEKPNNC